MLWEVRRQELNLVRERASRVDCADGPALRKTCDRDRRVQWNRRRDCAGAGRGRARVAAAPPHERLQTEIARPLDVSDTASCEQFVAPAVEQLGGLDILVNNAGLSRGRDPVWESDEQDEREVIETNVLGLMRMTRLCVPQLVEDGGGHIVNLGSVAGIWSYLNGSSYVASKFAVHGYTRALRDDLQGKPVRDHERRPGPRRDRVLGGSLPRRPGEGSRSTQTSPSGARCTPRTSPTASCSRSRGRRT